MEQEGRKMREKEEKGISEMLKGIGNTGVWMLENVMARGSCRVFRFKIKKMNVGLAYVAQKDGK